MSLWVVFEPVVIVLTAVFILSQVVIPPFIGKKTFWIFRKSEKKLHKREDELDDLKTEEEIVDIQKEIQKKKAELNDKMTGTV